MTGRVAMSPPPKAPRTKVKHIPVGRQAVHSRLELLDELGMPNGIVFVDDAQFSGELSTAV